MFPPYQNVLKKFRLDYEFSRVSLSDANARLYSRVVEAYLHSTEDDLRLSVCIAGYGALTFVFRDEKKMEDYGVMTNWNGSQNLRTFYSRVIYKPQLSESIGVGKDDDGSDFTMTLMVERENPHMRWGGTIESHDGSQEFNPTELMIVQNVGTKRCPQYAPFFPYKAKYDCYDNSCLAEAELKMFGYGFDEE